MRQRDREGNPKISLLCLFGLHFEGNGSPELSPFSCVPAKALYISSPENIPFSVRPCSTTQHISRTHWPAVFRSYELAHTHVPVQNISPENTNLLYLR